MVKLITEKTILPNSTIQSQTYYTPQNEPAKNVPSKENNSNKNLFFPLSLIAGGGILLYLGLKNPSKSKQVENFVKNRCAQMDSKINGFVNFVKNIIDEQYKEASTFIRNFKEERFLSPSNSVVHINMFDEPNKLANALDLAFEAIYSKDKELYKGGASCYDIFRGKITDISTQVSRAIDREKNRISLKLTDFTHMSQFKNGGEEELLQSGGNQLISMRNSIVMQMDSIQKSQLQAMQKRQLVNMADVIVQYRTLKTQTKEHIIDTSFNRVRHALKLDDNFVPLYNKTPYNLNEFENLQQALMPQNIPLKFKKIFGDNIFIRIAQEVDLNNLSQEDLVKLFNKITYDYNLKDLGYLIDRIRLRQATLGTNHPIQKEKYNALIAKLEFLSNELHKFGREELIKRCQKDFSQMNYGQINSALYQINTVSRRLGYESIELMDKDLAKNNPIYSGFNIRNYMKLFKDYPELYFM